MGEYKLNATCRGCGKTFETDRTDSIFCDGACKARWWRLMGQTGQHAKLENLTAKHCEHCGNMFWFNDYADRSGKRVPTYCRDACRVAAHRVRTKAKWSHEKTAKDDPKSWEAHKAKAKAPPPPKREAPFKTGDFRDGLRPPSRWSDSEAYEWLGVPYGADKSDCQAAWRRLNAAYHPDGNSGSVWPHLVYVNAAYDHLKRKVWKRR